MFTGLVEDVGTVAWVRPQGNGHRMGIRTTIPLDQVREGDSIAVDGVCLTAEGSHGDVFEVVAGKETLESSTLQQVRSGRRVHLERALALGDRLGGHLVQGHVDARGEVTQSFGAQESWVVWVKVPDTALRYVASKGSICMNGVSLTVNELDGPLVRVNVVPHTARVTRLGTLNPGDLVNIEVDVLAKYVERLLTGATARPGLSPEMLRRYGYEG